MFANNVKPNPRLRVAVSQSEQKICIDGGSQCGGLEPEFRDVALSAATTSGVMGNGQSAKPILAHKCVVGFHSNYLMELLRQCDTHVKVYDSGVVASIGKFEELLIPKVEHNALQVLITYMYTGSVELDVSTKEGIILVENVCFAADELGMGDLKDALIDAKRRLVSRSGN